MSGNDVQKKFNALYDSILAKKNNKTPVAASSSNQNNNQTTTSNNKLIQTTINATPIQSKLISPSPLQKLSLVTPSPLQKALNSSSNSKLISNGNNNSINGNKPLSNLGNDSDKDTPISKKTSTVLSFNSNGNGGYDSSDHDGSKSTSPLTRQIQTPQQQQSFKASVSPPRALKSSSTSIKPTTTTSSSSNHSSTTPPKQPPTSNSNSKTKQSTSNNNKKRKREEDYESEEEEASEKASESEEMETDQSEDQSGEGSNNEKEKKNTGKPKGIAKVKRRQKPVEHAKVLPNPDAKAMKVAGHLKSRSNGRYLNDTKTNVCKNCHAAVANSRCIWYCCAACCMLFKGVCQVYDHETKKARLGLDSSRANAPSAQPRDNQIPIPLISKQKKPKQPPKKKQKSTTSSSTTTTTSKSKKSSGDENMEEEEEKEEKEENEDEVEHRGDTDSDDEQEEEWVGDSIGEDSENRYYETMKRGKKVFNRGSDALLYSDRLSKPFVGRIISLSESKKSNEKQTLIQWYSYAEEIRNKKMAETPSLQSLLKSQGQQSNLTPLTEVLLTSGHHSQVTRTLKAPVFISSSPFSSDSNATLCCYRFIQNEKRSKNVTLIEGPLAKYELFGWNRRSKIHQQSINLENKIDFSKFGVVINNKNVANSTNEPFLKRNLRQWKTKHNNDTLLELKFSELVSSSVDLAKPKFEHPKLVKSYSHNNRKLIHLPSLPSKKSTSISTSATSSNNNNSTTNNSSSSFNLSKNNTNVSKTTLSKNNGNMMIDLDGEKESVAPVRSFLQMFENTPQKPFKQIQNEISSNDNSWLQSGMNGDLMETEFDPLRGVGIMEAETSIQDTFRRKKKNVFAPPPSSLSQDQ